MISVATCRITTGSHRRGDVTAMLLLQTVRTVAVNGSFLLVLSGEYVKVLLIRAQLLRLKWLSGHLL